MLASAALGTEDNAGRGKNKIYVVHNGMLRNAIVAHLTLGCGKLEYADTLKIVAESIYAAVGNAPN